MRLTDLHRRLHTSEKENGVDLLGILETIASRWEAEQPDQIPAEAGPTVMVGSSTGDRARDVYARLGLARMYASGKRVDPYEDEAWGFDNGAWSATHAGEGFPEDEFEERVRWAYELSDLRDTPPAVAAVPDKLWAGGESLEFSARWAEDLQQRYPDWPWFLVIQDGMGFDDVLGVLDLFDGLFLGGSDSVKGRARLWRDFAHDHDLPFHYGRGGTLAKVAQAFDIGADSVDSEFPVFSRIRMGTFVTNVLDMASEYEDPRSEGSWRRGILENEEGSE